MHKVFPSLLLLLLLLASTDDCWLTCCFGASFRNFPPLGTYPNYKNSSTVFGIELWLGGREVLLLCGRDQLSSLAITYRYSAEYDGTVLGLALIVKPVGGVS